MNLTLETSISAITVFFQGLISFFSPCVLPLIPLYIGYLSGGAKTVDEEGNIIYKRGRVMRNTLFFVLGISFAFFLLGFGFTAVGKFFHNYRTWFTRIGGIVVVLFGLYQLGLFGSLTLSKERRFHFQPDSLAMNPLTALILGFTFSFAWTPCVGPALASVLLLAASAASSLTGFLLLGVYTLGFVLPFLAVGLFTNALSSFFKKYRSAMKYTVKLGGILMVFIGVMMFTGWMNGISTYLSGNTSMNSTAEGNDTQNGNAAGTNTDANADPSHASNASQTESGNGENHAEQSNKAADETGTSATDSDAAAIPAPDFTLQDQYGNTHTFSDYKGKTVFLNFWATWCPPCRAETSCSAGTRSSGFPVGQKCLKYRKSMRNTEKTIPMSSSLASLPLMWEEKVAPKISPPFCPKTIIPIRSLWIPMGLSLTIMASAPTPPLL